MDGEGTLLPVDLNAEFERTRTKYNELAVRIKSDGDLEREIVGLYERLAEQMGQKHIYNTDIARELAPEYAESLESRAFYGDAVQKFAKAIAEAAWEQRLAESAVSQESNYVIVLAGGPGSGKGQVVDHWLQDASPPHAIYDTTFANKRSAFKKVADALKSGKRVQILYVNRDLGEAAFGVIERSARVGRMVPIEVFANDHHGAVNSVLKVADRYKDDPNVEVMVIDNLGGPSDLAAGTIQEIREKARNLLSKSSVLDKSKEAYSNGYARYEQEFGVALPGWRIPGRGQSPAKGAGRSTSRVSNREHEAKHRPQ